MSVSAYSSAYEKLKVHPERGSMKSACLKIKRDLFQCTACPKKIVKDKAQLSFIPGFLKKVNAERNPNVALRKWLL